MAKQWYHSAAKLGSRCKPEYYRSSSYYSAAQRRPITCEQGIELKEGLICILEEALKMMNRKKGIHSQSLIFGAVETADGLAHSVDWRRTADR